MSHAQAQVWLGGAEFRLDTLELPSPEELREGEVLVALETATVCGSDRHTVAGHRASPFPSILGHEGAGVVIASRRQALAPGARVVFGVTDTCGTCPRCRAGISAKCLQVRKVGHEVYGGPWLLDGTYATHIHLQAGQAIAEVPAHVDSASASTAGCAIATVMACLEQAGSLVGARVLVNGVGMLGLTAVVAARAAGAAQVIAVDPNAQARSLVGDLADRVVASLPQSTMVDAAFELSGAPAGVRATLASLDIGAVAILGGSVSPSPAVDLDPEWLVRGLRRIVGVHNYEPRHLHQAVDFLDHHAAQLPWEEILGAHYELTDLARAFSSAPQGLRDVIHMA